MVRAEDKQFENEIIDGGHHIAVPFEMSVSQDGIDILAYSFCMNIAHEFEDKYSADPTSVDARAFLYARLLPIMDELDYEADGDACRVHHVYRCLSPETSRILEKCMLIDSLDSVDYEEDLPLDEFELDPANPIDRMAVIKDGEKIVCFAGLNDISEDDGYAEITVECAKEYRNRGYGASCVAKLTEYLISVGEQVEYICADVNEASKKTAEAAGFELYKTVMPFVCYKKEFEEEI